MNMDLGDNGGMVDVDRESKYGQGWGQEMWMGFGDTAYFLKCGVRQKEKSRIRNVEHLPTSTYPLPTIWKLFTTQPVMDILLYSFFVICKYHSNEKKTFVLQ